MKSRILITVAFVLLMPLAACGKSGDSAVRAEPAATPGTQRLIGYQAKRLDQLIETVFDQLVREAGLSRREWQTLNTIADGGVDEAGLVDALRPFWEVNRENVGDVVGSLTERGWVEGNPAGYTLTAAGSDAHTRAAETIGRIRDLAAAGVTDAEFAAMMDTMARIIANLEQATP